MLVIISSLTFHIIGNNDCPYWLCVICEILERAAPNHFSFIRSYLQTNTKLIF